MDTGNPMSESSDDSCGDSVSQDTSCNTTATVTTATTTTARISRDGARLGPAMTSRDDDDDDDDDDVFIGNHGNRAAAAAGWTDLCRSQTLRHRLSPMSTCPVAVTIGQS